MKSMTELIRDHAFLRGMEDAQCALIAGCSRNIVFPAGSYIVREGQPADAFYLLRHGHVALELYTPGGAPFVLQTLGPGDILGETWIVPPYVCAFDARAMEQVRAFAFDATCLRGKAETDPALGYALMKRFVPILVRHVHAARMQALDVYGRRS